MPKMKIYWSLEYAHKVWSVGLGRHYLPRKGVVWNHCGIHTSRREALAALRSCVQSGYTDVAYRVVKANWRLRERARFDFDDYKRPVWATEAFWINRPRSLVEHFAHVSHDDPTQIAFTPSEEYGKAGRHVRMKPGRYLAKFFADVLTPKQIAFYAEWYAKGEKPETEEISKLKFGLASTPDEIADVYVNGPASCMKEFNYDRHPARVYGAGDLAIAYLKEGERYRARALVWPEKKVVGRVYPTADNWQVDAFSSREESQATAAKLSAVLRNEGYRSVYEHSWSLFDGARLLKIDRGNGYVMPYIDGSGCSSRGEFFVLSTRGDHCCDNTDGTLDGSCEDDDDGTMCERCEHDFNVDDTTSVVVRLNPRRHYETWCDSCAGNYAVNVHGIDERVSTNVDGLVELANCDYATEADFEADGYECGFSGDKYLHGDIPAHEVHVEGRIETWARPAAVANAFICGWDQQWYPYTVESVTHPGFPAEFDDNAEITPELRAKHRRREQYHLRHASTGNLLRPSRYGHRDQPPIVYTYEQALEWSLKHGHVMVPIDPDAPPVEAMPEPTTIEPVIPNNRLYFSEVGAFTIRLADEYDPTSVFPPLGS